jgi:hypothetical protein
LIPRLVEMGASFAGEDGIEPEAEKTAIAALDRLAVSRVSKSGDALDTLTAESQAEGQEMLLDMVVIDSLDALLGGEALTGSSAQGAFSSSSSLLSLFRMTNRFFPDRSCKLDRLYETSELSCAIFATAAGHSRSSVLLSFRLLLVLSLPFSRLSLPLLPLLHPTLPPALRRHLLSNLLSLRRSPPYLFLRLSNPLSVRHTPTSLTYRYLSYLRSPCSARKTAGASICSR